MPDPNNPWYVVLIFLIFIVGAVVVGTIDWHVMCETKPVPACEQQ